MGDDDTVVLRPRRRRWPFAAAAVVLVALCGGAGVLWFARPGPPATVQQAPPGGIARFASEAEIDAHDPAEFTLYRFAPNPAILVLDFPELASQGRMLNRIAAWAEKKGVTHERVLTDPELDAAIRTSGATPDTYYYGHDYRGGDVLRFFALADRDHVVLRPDEERLRVLARQAGAEPWGFGAVISLPRVGSEPTLDAVERAVILHHELSHGEYFTNATYARFVASVWQTVLTEGERARFRSYLSRDDYDPAIEDLMMNEMQAYLMHTPDERFFDEKALGIAPPRLAEIRTAFVAGMPTCWLRDVTPDVSLMRRIRGVPRRRRGRVIKGRVPRRRMFQGRVTQGLVTMTRALVATLPPRRRKASIPACRSRR